MHSPGFSFFNFNHSGSSLRDFTITWQSYIAFYLKTLCYTENVQCRDDDDDHHHHLDYNYYFLCFFLYIYIYFVWLRGDNWEFVKAFVPIAFLIYISSLTKIILDIKFPLGYLLNFLFLMNYYRFSWILIKTSRRSSLLTGKLRFYSRFAHRRTGNFSPGGR